MARETRTAVKIARTERWEVDCAELSGNLAYFEAKSDPETESQVLESEKMKPKPNQKFHNPQP